MTSISSSTSEFEMCHILSLSVLRNKELETIAAFVKLLSDALDSSQGRDCERHFMAVGGLRFLSWTKVIPLVELYCVFNKAFYDGANKPIPSKEDRGYYNFGRKAGGYRFRPAAYRRTADKLMIGEVKKLIKHGCAALPAEICEIGMTETATSLVVLFHFRSCTSTTLAVALTPAIAGTDLPDGCNRVLRDLFHQEWESGGPGCRWFLVPPPMNLKLSPYSWQLVFPGAYDLVPEFKGLVSAALLLCYVAEIRKWTRLGLHTPQGAIWSAAMTLNKEQMRLLSQASLREQLTILLERLRAATLRGKLLDFAVPSRNYLDNTNKMQKSRLAREFQKGIEQLTSVDHFLNTYVGDRFPLPLPQYSKSNSCQLNEKCHAIDDEYDSELTTDSDIFSPSKKGTNIEACMSQYDCTTKFPSINNSNTSESDSKEIALQKASRQSHDSLTDLVTLIIMLVAALVCLGLLLSAYSDNFLSRSRSHPHVEEEEDESDEYDDDEDEACYTPRYRSLTMFPLP